MTTLLQRPPAAPPSLTRGHAGGVELLPSWYKPYNLDPTKLASRPRVGLDLDGCFYDFAAALRHYLVICHGYTPEELPDATRWEFYLDWGLSLEEFLTLCHQGADFIFTTGHVMPGAREAAFDLYEAGFELHVITDRSFGTPGVSRRATERWLVREFIPHHSLTIAADKTAIWTDYMVDDRPENYDALAAAGTQVYLLDRPWNRHHHVPRRVHSMAEFAAAVIADARDHHASKDQP